MTLMPVSNNFGLGREFVELRRLAVDRAVFLGVDRPAAVDRFAQQVEDAAERLLADRHCHGRAGIDHVHAAHQAVGRAEGDAADPVAAEVLLHLAGQLDLHALDIGFDREGVVDLRQVAFLELGVERRADDLHDLAGMLAVICGCNHHMLPMSCCHLSFVARD